MTVQVVRSQYPSNQKLSHQLAKYDRDKGQEDSYHIPSNDGNQEWVETVRTVQGTGQGKGQDKG
jgi:hypothetical protein